MPPLFPGWPYCAASLVIWMAEFGVRLQCSAAARRVMGLWCLLFSGFPPSIQQVRSLIFAVEAATSRATSGLHAQRFAFISLLPPKFTGRL